MNPGKVRSTVVGVSCTMVFVWSACDTRPDADGGVRLVARTAAESVLTRALAYHDPDAVWGRLPVLVEWWGTNPDGSERVDVEVTFQPANDVFQLSGRYRGSALEYRAEHDLWSATVDGERELEAEVLDGMRLAREGGLFWRNYFGFLIGMPMKLLDSGTIIDPEATVASFMGQSALTLRVTYDPEVGGDTWYFYFDPDTAALLGCRFYHDEAANDGEYIVFDGVTVGDGLRLPRGRRWYVNADDRFLGADELRSIRIIGAG